MVAGELTSEGAIDLLRDAFADEPGLRGLFLAGSHGRGTADEWSDLDFVGIAGEAEHPALADRWLAVVGGAADVVHVMRRRMGPTGLLNLVTADWLRIDLLLVPSSAFAQGRARDGVTPLFDRDGLAEALPDTLPPRAPDPRRVAHLVTEFLRVLGLLPVVAGRGEWVVAAAGTGLLRNFVQELLTEGTTVPDRGGALGLRRLLPPEDLRLLEALPYPPPERGAVIAAHAELARLFLPRARAMYERLGLDWPQPFEDATRRRLRAALGDAAAHW